MKWVFAVGDLPAPLTPLLASATMPRVEVDQPRGHQRLQRQNDRGRVAAGIGDEARSGNLCAMQLRHSVNGLRLGGRGQFGVVVLEGVDSAVGRLGEPPRAAQVDDPHSVPERIRNPLARLLVRRGEKQNVNAPLCQQLPGKGLQLQGACASAIGQLRMNFGQRQPAAGRVALVHAAGEDRGLALETGMPQQQPGQFGARVPCDSHYRCLHRIGHDSSIVLNRDSTSLARRRSGQITSTVSSPARVPTTSVQPSWSSAAANGCAPPVTVVSTT